jgi:hypothetical protein
MQMKIFESYSRVLPWTAAILLSTLVAACGGGGDGERAPILGSGDVSLLITPTVTGVAPLANATGLPINTKVIRAVFSQAMDPSTLTSTSFALACPAGVNVAGEVTYSTANNEAMLTLAAATNLAPNTVCTATITKGAKDMAGTALASNFVWTFMTSAASDTTAPEVTATLNANGASGVPINTKVGVTFSEGIEPLTVNTSTFTLKQGANAIAGTTSYSGVNAVFTPTNALANNTTYTATITTGAKDLAGNALANNYVWSWSTGAVADTTAPMVTGTVNANGATGVPTNTKVGATFNETMDPFVILTSTPLILKQGSTEVVGSTTYSGGNIIFTPTSALAANTTYTATITTAAKDMAGNAVANPYVWSWTTGSVTDTTAPTVTATIHANGATAVPTNTKVGATFSEAIDPLSINTTTLTLKQGTTPIAGTTSYSGVTAVFSPAGVLANNTTYTATVTTGVKDLAGNALATPYVWSWTTAAAADTTPPTVTATINANGATGVATNTKVGATFSEAIDPLTLNNTTFTLNQGTNSIAGTTSYSGVNAVFIPASALASNTTYTASITTGARDLSGNALATPYVWSWTTAAAADTAAPTVTLVNPADSQTNVAINSTVNATFSETIDPLTISTATFTVAGVTGTVGYDAVSKIASFTPSVALANNTSYNATVKGGPSGVKDLAGNALNLDKVWSFTTAATPGVPVPVVSAVNLGSAARFGTFGGTAGMTSSGLLTVVNGDIGTTAVSTAVTGFHDTGTGCIYSETTLNKGFVNGLIFTAAPPPTVACPTEGTAATFATATQGRADALAAYNALAALPAGANPGANLAGKTLAPGTYTAPAGSFMIQGGDLTLDAQGNANAVWVFQMATSLTVGGPGAAAPQSIILAGGAQAKNVFWQVGSAATINAGGGGTMVGTIIAQAGAAFSTAGNVTLVTLNGRALSLGASVTLVNTVINVPAP